MRDLSREIAQHDFEHAKLRVRLFVEDGLHAGVHQNEDLSEESQKLLRAADDRRLELAREARALRESVK